MPTASPHNQAQQLQPPIADIAVNLGLKYDKDLQKLYDDLAAAGVKCGLRAMSLGAEQIVVERNNFDDAKFVLTNIIVKERLTVRVYTSPDFLQFPDKYPLEVWQKGRKIREEQYKLY